MHTISRAEKVQALVFLAVGLLAIAVVCGVLIGIPLIKDTRQYFVRVHESTVGIDPGTAVRYWGVKVGRVKKVTIDYDDIQLELELDPTLRVTNTTQARIASQGLLGPYFIELYGTERTAPELPEGAVIKTDPSTMKTFLEMGKVTVEHLDTVLKNLEHWTAPGNEGRLAKLVDEATSALANANATMTAVRPETERLLKNYADAGDELAKALSENREALRGLFDETRKVAAEINRFLASGRLDQVANEASRTFESMRGDLNRATNSFTQFVDDAKIDERLSQVVASLDRTEQSLTKLSGVIQGEVLTMTRSELNPALHSFREAMTTLQELMRVLRDDPSLVIFSKPRPEVQIPRPGTR